MCVCAGGKISRVSTLDFAAETLSFVILCVIVFCLSALRYATHWFIVFWHVNFGWLWTNNSTWLQRVSSNICNFFDSFRYSFHAFDVQLLLVGAQVCDPLINYVWHVNFGWLSTNNPTWLQYVSSNICKYCCLLTSHFVPLSCNSCLSVLVR